VRGNHIRNGVAKLRESFELSGAECDGNELKIGLAGLQEGQLDFRGVLAAVSWWNLPGAAGSAVSGRKRTRLSIADVAQRSFPIVPSLMIARATAHAGVVGAHHEAELGNLQFSKHGACHVSGIHVAGVGDDTAESVNRLLVRSLRQVGARTSWRRVFGIAGIESSGDRGMANGGQRS
jgi:hypothetical protein